MYNAEKPSKPGDSAEKHDTTATSEDETMEQQLKEASYEHEKKLPDLFERVLSPDSSSNVNVLPKLMIWDSLIQFLSDLDVLSRVQYTLKLPVVYTDEILNVLFTLLPKDPELHLSKFRCCLVL